MTILTSLVFAVALYLTGIFVAKAAFFVRRNDGGNITAEAVLFALAWGLFYYLTH